MKNEEVSTKSDMFHRLNTLPSPGAVGTELLFLFPFPPTCSYLSRLLLGCVLDPMPIRPPVVLASPNKLPVVCYSFMVFPFFTAVQRWQQPLLCFTPHCSSSCQACSCHLLHCMLIFSLGFFRFFSCLLPRALLLWFLPAPAPVSSPFLCLLP